MGRLDRLDLQPLSPDESSALLTTALGGSVDPDAAQRLWQRTRGNVLYLRNIVEQEVADGRLARQHGCWRWTGDPIMVPGLVELIESRMGALPTAVSTDSPAIRREWDATAPRPDNLQNGHYHFRVGLRFPRFRQHGVCQCRRSAPSASSTRHTATWGVPDRIS
jgi:hypothetical protein